MTSADFVSPVTPPGAVVRADGPEPRGATRTPSIGRAALKVLLIVTGGVVGVVLGALLPQLGVGPIVTVVGGMVGVVVLGGFALVRFEWFVWTILLIRPALDITRIGAVSTESGTLTTMVGGSIIIVGGVWLAALSRGRRRIPMGTIGRALCVLMITSVPSVVGADNVGESAAQLARTLGAVVMFLVLEQLIRSRATALKTLAACGLSAIVPLAAGLYQLVTGSAPKDVDGLVRITGSFVHPNSLGFFLVIILLMGYCLRRHVGRRIRWCIDVAMLITVVELVFTYSRGSWLALAAGLLVVAFVADRKLFVIIPMVGAAAYVLVPQIRERLADLTSSETVGGRPANSASWRLAHAQELISDVHGQTLFGIGPGMADNLTEGGRAPHNDFVRLFVENGTVGLACYVAFIVGLTVLAVRAVRHLNDGMGRGLAVGFAAVVAAFVVDSVGANLITQFLLLIYVFSLAAIVHAWMRIPATTGPTENVPVLRLDARSHPETATSESEGHPHGRS